MSGVICLIDDDEDVREVMSYTLMTEGYEVVVFASAIDALGEFKKDKNFLPALIIVDYLMPEMNGITFIKELKTNFYDRLGRVPVAICSATDSFEGEDEILSGVMKLCKPMELDDLLELVGKCARGNQGSLDAFWP